MIVFKYPLGLSKEIIEVELPSGSRVIHFAPQTQILTMWIEVPKRNESTVKRYFSIFGTGAEIPDPEGITEGSLYKLRRWEHRGTCLQGPFVWHLYERHDLLVHSEIVSKEVT